MLKAAVIGCGRMGAEPSVRLEGKVPAGWIPISHIESFIQARNVELIALAEINKTRLKWAGDFYGVRNLYESHEKLFLENSLDLVGIATRTPEKLKILEKAICSGIKGVYIEKPLTDNLGSAKKILNDAEREGVVISYGVNRRYHALYRQARDLVSAGEIGGLLEIIIEFGESQLLWSHPHSVDLMIFLSGQRPLEVQSGLLSESVIQLSELHIDSDPIVSYAQFWFDGGARGFILRGRGCNVRITGTQGSIEIMSDGASLQLRKSSAVLPSYFLRQETIFPVVSRSATVVAIEELAEKLKGHPVTSISHDEIYAGMQMLWACVFSHIQNGKRCRLVDVPEDLIITGKYGNAYV